MKAVKSTTESFSAAFLGELLSGVNKQIYSCGWRQGRCAVQRKDTSTIITSVGDVTFDCTYYKRLTSEGGYVSLLEEMIGLDKHERFSEEADEDHVVEQHGNCSEEDKSLISKLVYAYECKQESSGCKDKKELVSSFYFSGLYPDKEGNEKLWKNVQNYINTNYDVENLKRISISGDGASWIKTGVDYIDKALFCADKFHLMKYINRAVAQMLDEKEIAKDELWHLLYSKKLKTKERFKEYTECMINSAKNPMRVEELQKYVLGNWAAIRRTLRNKLVNGCSAESHAVMFYQTD